MRTSFHFCAAPSPRVACLLTRTQLRFTCYCEHSVAISMDERCLHWRGDCREAPLLAMTKSKADANGGKQSGRKDTKDELYFGYKVDVVADANHGLPMFVTPRPANANDLR